MDLSLIIIEKDISIKKAIEVLDKSAKKILLVAKDNILLGVITDGDIRRWILKNGDINNSVENIMNTSPVYMTEYNKKLCMEIMKEKSITAIPIVDNNMKIKDIVFFEDVFYKVKDSNVVAVIMAGGKGTRLYPYTKIIPKPLIPIGDVTIIERIMNKFLDFNINNFYLTINYKKDMIKAYFNDNKKYNIDFAEENNPLGTAGSLSLLKGKVRDSFFVSNCDILVDADYLDILKEHKKNQNKITIVAVLKYYKIPYGVINLNKDGFVHFIDEKPEYNFLVNTGMYILEPDVLDNIPDDTYFDMPDLINYYLQTNQKVGVYPISNNSWLDMGEFKEMENMIERLK